MVYIPKGFAHGFQTLADNTEIFYQISESYRSEASRGARWNDPAFAIDTGRLRTRFFPNETALFRLHAMKRVLVTGANEFIGRQCLPLLLARP